MPESTNPAADNTIEFKIAELQRQVENLAAVPSVFKTGDYLFSEATHPLMVGTTLSDGGRPGWWLMNGATFTAADDPALFGLRGVTTLPDFQDRVLGVPGATNAAWLATGSAASGGGTTDTAATHTHATDAAATHTHTLPAMGAPTTNQISAGALGEGTYTAAFDHLHSLSATDAAGAHSHTAAAGGAHSHTVTGGSNMQPTRFCGTAWIKR